MAAFSIPSQKLQTLAPIGQLYNFLSKFENFAGILPDDKVEDFKYSDESCSFTIKGITAMTIRLQEKEENSFLLFHSEGLARFNFFLKASFEGDAALPGLCNIELSGDLNPFIKTMAEKPLTALVTSMSQKLSQLQPTQL